MTTQIAVLIPCLNEVATVGQVVRDFRAALPEATVYVYDNGSTDETAAAARAAGATVRCEPRRGKGNVLRRMFAEVEADVYIMVDGDATYDAASAAQMVRLVLEERVDMVTAVRRAIDGAAYRTGHAWGNEVFSRVAGWLFGARCGDIFSGYRALSRRAVKSFPALVTGFEVETELTVHALGLGLPVAEVSSPYRARPDGSASKLNTWRDGLRIALRLASLVRTERPAMFFGVLGAGACLVSLALADPLIRTYLDTGLVPRFPTAILATGLMLSGFIAAVCGVILQSVARLRRETLRLAYLTAGRG